MKSSSTFLKVPGMETHHQMLFIFLPKALVGGGGSYSTAEVQAVFFLQSQPIERCILQSQLNSTTWVRIHLL